MTAVLVMKQGITVNGKVLGPKGTPIAGATIGWGEYWGGDGLPKTDREGRFRIPNLPPGDVAITVCASGCAPDRKKITVGPDTRTVEFKLQAAKPLKGRVVDEAGMPIALAQVSVQYWRGSRCLQWQAKTDAQGRFSWAEPPADEVTLGIDAEGYMGEGPALVPKPDEHVIVLKKNMVIKGRVVDAVTGPADPLLPGDPGLYRRRWHRALVPLQHGQGNRRHLQPHTDDISPPLQRSDRGGRLPAGSL